jgi:hypothetical protein
VLVEKRTDVNVQAFGATLKLFGKRVLRVLYTTSISTFLRRDRVYASYAIAKGIHAERCLTTHPFRTGPALPLSYVNSRFLMRGLERHSALLHRPLQSGMRRG